MKNKTFFKLALSMTLIGALSGLAGCKKKDEVQKRVDADSVSFPLEEKASFTMLTRTPSDSEQDFSKKYIVQELEKETNVTVDFDVIPDNQFDDKLNLILSKKDLPDVVTKMYMPPYNVSSYAKKGVFIELENLIDKYMPNLKELLEKRPEVRKAITSPDGHIYTLPFIEETKKGKVANNVIGAVPYINKTWLDTLGLPVPTTTEELEETLLKFKNEDPNGNGKKDEIPMSFRINQVNQDPGILLGAFGCGDNTDHYMVTNDKKVYYTLQSDDIKEGLTWLHGLYSDGLIDPDVFTQENDTYLAKGQQGLYGLFLNWDKESVAQNPDEFIALPTLTGPTGIKNVPRQNYYSFDMGVTAITSSAVNPELIAKWIDLSFAKDQSIQNKFGTYDNPEGFNVLNKTGENSYSFNSLPENQDLTFDQISNNQNLNSFYAILEEYYNDGLEMRPEDVKRLEIIKRDYAPYIMDEYNYPPVFMTTEDLESISQIETDLKSYAESQKSKFVKNGVSSEDWDAYLKKLDSMKLDELIELKQKGFDDFYKN